ncbi:hypothetical protein [Inhella proteolytica]|uniref:Uncharacterized protein n=1 Tax=Inhella proteolytica TaxID=2795029 RepID=A0A931NIB6_9BURK|nr:hypothetical protein [Inhella proteolytica]MBH9578673.1 hypothetical protein [Inhella proteolytica]
MKRPPGPSRRAAWRMVAWALALLMLGGTCLAYTQADLQRVLASGWALCGL